MTQDDVENKSNEDVATAGRLRAWLEEHSIYVHPDIEICSNGHAGSEIQVRAKAGVLLHPHTVIGIIPKSAILSPRTSALSAHLPRANLRFFFSPQATCGLLLSTCLLFEVLLGEKSRWFGYIQALPRGRCVDGEKTLGISLPLEWSKNSLEWKTIEHCETGRLIQRAERRSSLPPTKADHLSLDILKDHFNKEAYPLLCSTGMLSRIRSDSLESLFIGCYTLVSSRAFICDTYHGLALCPFADAFNHADYGENQVQFECDDEILPSSATFSHEETIHMSMTSSVFGYDPHSSVELYNSYGPLSNAVLLTRYGFALEDETNSERFTWDWRDRVERHEIICVLFGGRREEQSMEAAISDIALAGNIQKWATRIGMVCGDATLPDEIFPSSYKQRQEEDTTSTSCYDTEALPPLPRPSPFAHLASLDLHHDAETSEALGSVFAQPAQSGKGAAHDSDDNSTHDDWADDEDDDDVDDSLASSADVDAHLPLYVDQEGRISLALWRAVVLACVPQDDNDLKQVLHRVEQLAAATLEDHEPDRRSFSQKSVTECLGLDSSAMSYKLLQNTLCILENLLSIRISRLALSPKQRQTDPENATDTDIQQHASRHFYQEKAIMDIALHRLHNMQCSLSRNIH